MRRPIQFASFQALACLFAALIEGQSSRPFNYDRDIGIAVVSSTQACLEFPRPLTRGSRLSFVTTKSPSTGELAVLRSARAYKLAGDQHPQWHHYYVRVIRGSLPKSVPAFVLANFHGSFQETALGVTADLDRNGAIEFFRSCTSVEGVHLTIWAGKPLEGQRKWHDYYYLGYDVDADCTAAETRTAPRPE